MQLPGRRVQMASESALQLQKVFACRRQRIAYSLAFVTGALEGFAEKLVRMSDPVRAADALRRSVTLKFVFLPRLHADRLPVLLVADVSLSSKEHLLPKNVFQEPIVYSSRVSNYMALHEYLKNYK